MKALLPLYFKGKFKVHLEIFEVGVLALRRHTISIGLISITT